jgi:hypothetical protein
VDLASKLEVYFKRNNNITRNAIPHPMATILSRVLSTGILLEYSCDRLRSSEVIRSTIAVKASQMLSSESAKGIIIIITLSIIQNQERSECFPEDTSTIFNVTF